MNPENKIVYQRDAWTDEKGVKPDFVRVSIPLFPVSFIFYQCYFYS